ncbi:MAG: hypothetical protein ACJ77B_08110 [Chloroflexota bacterium]
MFKRYRILAMAGVLAISAIAPSSVGATRPGRTFEQLASQLQASSDPQASFEALPAADKEVLRSATEVATTSAGTLTTGVASPITAVGLLAVTSSCYYAYWIAEARNVTGLVLFQYKEQVNWCSDGTKITSASRFTQPITPRAAIWQYCCETIFDLSYNSTRSTVTAAARGTFNQLLPPLGIVIGQSHPLVSITARANGTASGTISW